MGTPGLCRYRLVGVVAGVGVGGAADWYGAGFERAMRWRLYAWIVDMAGCGAVLGRMCCRCRYWTTGGGVAYLVEERKMSRNSSPTPSPLGLMRLQVSSTGVCFGIARLLGQSEALPAVR